MPRAADTSTQLSYAYHCLRRDISNFSLVKRRQFDGVLISMHQSGTHWLKHMLACALTDKHGLPPPEYIHANDVIAGPRDRRMNDLIPHLVSAHSIPHALFRSKLFHSCVSLPPYVVLVRDIRATLVSNYEKWKEHYQCDFEEFLLGDISGQRFNNDIWWCIRFCNMWGAIQARVPGSLLLVRYEDLRKSTLEELQRINRYWQLQLADNTLERAIAASSKEAMSLKKDPDTPFGVNVVRNDGKPWKDWFEGKNAALVSELCDAFLKYDHGYDYSSIDH